MGWRAGLEERGGGAKVSGEVRTGKEKKKELAQSE